jgi:hypothetical protein
MVEYEESVNPIRVYIDALAAHYRVLLALQVKVKNETEIATCAKVLDQSPALAAVRGIEADAKWTMFAKQPMPTLSSKPVSQKRREIQHRIGLLPNLSTTTSCQRPSLEDITTPNSLLSKCRSSFDPARGAGFNVSTQGWLKMETIRIPSPSVFLSSPVVQSAKPPPTTNATPPKRKTTAPKQSSAASKASTGVTKPKQSKSRNGGYSTPKSSYLPIFLAR